MRLSFGSIDFETRGLPRIYSLRVSPSRTGAGLLTVSILLESEQRAAVAKWADRLGVEVVDCKPYQSRPGDPWTQTFEAAREAEGYRVRVWTSRALDPAAVPVEAEGLETAPLHLPARGLQTTTACQGEPLAADDFAAREADVTCPACRALLAEPNGDAR